MPPEYRITCSPLVAALDVADDLVQRKPEEGTNASVDASCSGHRHALNPDGSNLIVNCGSHGSTPQQNRPWQKEPILQVQVRGAGLMPTGTLNQTPPDASVPLEGSATLTPLMGGEGSRQRRSPPATPQHALVGSVTHGELPGGLLQIPRRVHGMGGDRDVDDLDANDGRQREGRPPQPQHALVRGAAHGECPGGLLQS